jgi:hypothetical protein
LAANEDGTLMKEKDESIQNFEKQIAKFEA